MAEKARGRCGARVRIDQSCFSRRLVPRPRIFEFKKATDVLFSKTSTNFAQNGILLCMLFLSQYPFPLKPSQSERQECYNSIIERTTGSTPHMLYLFRCLFSNNSFRLTR